MRGAFGSEMDRQILGWFGGERDDRTSGSKWTITTLQATGALVLASGRLRQGHQAGRTRLQHVVRGDGSAAIHRISGMSGLRPVGYLNYHNEAYKAMALGPPQF